MGVERGLVALVTGSTSGIGQEVARCLYPSILGCHLVDDEIETDARRSQALADRLGDDVETYGHPGERKKSEVEGLDQGLQVRREELGRTPFWS